jgi:hypothetical protein
MCISDYIILRESVRTGQPGLKKLDRAGVQTRNHELYNRMILAP